MPEENLEGRNGAVVPVSQTSRPAGPQPYSSHLRPFLTTTLQSFCQEVFLCILAFLQESSFWFLDDLLRHADLVKIYAFIIAGQTHRALLRILHVMWLFLLLTFSLHHFINCCVVLRNDCQLLLLLANRVLSQLILCDLFHNQN